MGGLDGDGGYGASRAPRPEDRYPSYDDLYVATASECGRERDQHQTFGILAILGAVGSFQGARRRLHGSPRPTGGTDRRLPGAGGPSV